MELPCYKKQRERKRLFRDIAISPLRYEGTKLGLNEQKGPVETYITVYCFGDILVAREPKTGFLIKCLFQYLHRHSGP